MNRESEQYRFARLEAYHATLAHLEEQFRDRAVNLEEMEAAFAEHLGTEWLCAPWRQSENERAGCREGMRLAGLQFLSHYREAIELLCMHRASLQTARVDKATRC
jgi:hypothetical protein